MDRSAMQTSTNHAHLRFFLEEVLILYLLSIAVTLHYLPISEETNSIRLMPTLILTLV
jgi:hypothetical protein